MSAAGGAEDARDAPIELLSGSEIRNRWGPMGPEGYLAGAWPAGSITDDTPKALFTVEGVVRARTRGLVRGICKPARLVLRPRSPPPR